MILPDFVCRQVVGPGFCTPKGFPAENVSEHFQFSFSRSPRGLQGVSKGSPRGLQGVSKGSAHIFWRSYPDCPCPVGGVRPQEWTLGAHTSSMPLILLQVGARLLQSGRNT